MLKVCVIILILCGIAYGLKNCFYNQKTYASGSKFRSLDGCNTCYCTNGFVSCTKVGCLRPKALRAAVPGIQCIYGNHTYNSGDGFKSLDGCNRCGCSNGMVMCTLMACV